MYDSDHILNFGSYKNWALKDVPVKYLLDYFNSKGSDYHLMQYIDRNLINPPRVTEPVIEKCTKITFLSRKEANYMINKAKWKEQEHKKPVRSYQCERCGFWHLTSKEKI